MSITISFTERHDPPNVVKEEDVATKAKTAPIAKKNAKNANLESGIATLQAMDDTGEMSQVIANNGKVMDKLLNEIAAVSPIQDMAKEEWKKTQTKQEGFREDSLKRKRDRGSNCQSGQGHGKCESQSRRKIEQL